MSLIAVPSSESKGNKWALRIAAPVVGITVLVVAFWFWGGFSSSSPVVLGQFYSVTPMDLDIKISKDGELAAVNNIDIICNVEGQSAIQTIVPEGATVKKGDVLVVLDSAAIKQKIEDTTLDLQKAEADLTTSQELKEIQESQNAANLEAAQVALTLAQLDLQAYTDGTYPQDLQNAQTALQMAEITLKNKQEKLSETKALFTKGFVNATDVKNDELDLTTAQNALAQAKSALQVLTDYTHAKDMAAKKNALSQADKLLARTKRENAANLSQRMADVQAKTQAFEVIKRRMEHLQDQLANCTITAPADGLVVYASSGDRWSDQRIQEGATVRERQVLLRLPDTSSMKAIARINESQVGKLSEGLRAKVRLPSVTRVLGATVKKISVLADSGQRFYNPDLKEYPVDLVLDETPKSLKPGMGASVEILVNHLSNVLAVPLAAVYSAGPDTYVFVRDGEKVKPVKVKIGQTNDTHAQIRDGMDAGASVLLLAAGQGRDLLEQNGIKVEGPSTRGSDDFGPRKGRGNRNGNGAAGANPDAPRPEGAPPGAGPNPGPGADGKVERNPASPGQNRRADAPTTTPAAQ